LRDASAFNVQFTGSGPIFIDHLSFAPYTEGAYWQGHDQFCRQFLNPLLLEARAGVAANAWYRGSPEGLPGGAVYRLLPWSSRLKPGIFLNVALPETLSRRGNGDDAARVRAQRPLRRATLLAMLQQLKRLVLQLDIARQATAWSGYTESRSYADDALTAKMEFVRASIAQARPAMAWDLGCNTGEFAELALRAGARFVVGFDSDRTAVELAYARARGRNLSFLPLHADLLNPTPALGWRGFERASLMERANADFTLALALVHHLVFHGNVPLEEVVGWVTALAPAGVIEFVPKSDPMVQRLLSLRDDLFPSYSEEVFRAAIRKRAKIAAEMRVPGSARLLVRYARA
jgi:ribosomal protein L11 methylase PrmA